MHARTLPLASLSHLWAWRETVLKFNQSQVQRSKSERLINAHRLWQKAPHSQRLFEFCQLQQNVFVQIMNDV